MIRLALRLLVAAVAAFGGLAMHPAPASAFGAGVFVFTAPAQVSNQIFAPVGVGNPHCGNTGLCPDGSGSFNFSTNYPPSACVGAAVDLTATAVGVGFCQFSASGSISNVAGLGAWCGLSSGSGTSSASVSPGVLFSVSISSSVQWLFSAGTVLPLIFTGGATGVGAVQVTGLNPGPCGLGSALGNPSGATTFQVTGFAALVAV